jgi:hypothetical protein
MTRLRATHVSVHPATLACPAKPISMIAPQIRAIEEFALMATIRLHVNATQATRVYCAKPKSTSANRILASMVDIVKIWWTVIGVGVHPAHRA